MERQMSNAVVGSLRVVLGIDTAAFSDGLKKATSGLADAGKRMQDVGKTLTKNVSAPLAATAAALGLGLGKLSGDLAALKTQASVANVTVEEFQRLAFAAKSVGIENDKLADILKDTTDKVGDFLTTGGGPMADFFEQIAPQVGVTADAFRNLSGADALQLYVSSLEKAGVSQSEMTFYMEALASDATALLPLLRDNGAEMGRLGDKAAKFGLATGQTAEDAVKFQESMRALGAAVSGVGIALANSGILDTMAQLVERVAEWTSVLGQVDPQIVQFGLILGGLAAALGPVLVALGIAATAIAAIGAPVVAVVAGIAALTAAVVAFWPEIQRANAALTAWVNDIEARAIAALKDLGAAFVRAKDDVIAFGTQALDWIKAKPAEIAAAFSGLREKFMQIGRDILQGLWDGLKESWGGMSEWWAGIAGKFETVIRAVTRTQSPSQAFYEVGIDLMAGLKLGIQSGAEAVAGALTGVAQNAVAGMQALLGVGQDVASGLSGINNRMSKTAQKFAAAIALVNAYQAASATLADPRLPWFARIAAAGSVLAAGLGFVSAIKSGGSGGKGGGGKGGGGSQRVPTPTQTAVTTTEQKQAPLDIRLHLPERGVFTKAQLAEILDGINREAGDRGMRLLVVK
jgi:hypothetical protein